jgi:hypothetical protein
MSKTAAKPATYTQSVTSVTKRDKRDKSNLGNRRDSVTTPPVGGLSCHACPGTYKFSGVDPGREGGDKTVVRFLLAIRIESEANLSGHWRGKAARVKLQRSITRTMVGQKLREIGVRPGDLLAGEGNCLVVLTRVAPRPLDDDNLARSLKAVRDGVADAFKTDDGVKSKLKWRYGQEKGPPKQYAVRIQIKLNGESRKGDVLESTPDR